MVTVPFGITGEVGIIPNQTVSGIKVNTLNFGLKWTVTEVFLSDLPFSLAGKVAFTSSNVDFSQTVSGTQVDYSFKDKSTTALALISKNFAIVEPYAGVGMVSANGDLSASVPIYQSGSKAASDSRSGLTWMVGT